MKKLMGILLGLSLVIGSASIAFAAQKEEKKEDKKKKGGKKKKSGEEKKPV